LVSEFAHNSEGKGMKRGEPNIVLPEWIKELQNNFDDKIGAHWKYIREVIRDGRNEDGWIHMPIQCYLDIIGYHYKTAMEHGYKHGAEDSQSSTPTTKNTENVK